MALECQPVLTLMFTDMSDSGYIDPLEGQYAGFWRRFFAAVIDMVIYTPVYYGIHAACRNHGLAEIIFAVVAVVSYAGFFASKFQASPGMLLLNFHVCDVRGGRINFKQALLWNVVAAIGVAICFSGLIYMQYHFDLVAIRDLMLSCAEENVRMEDCMSEAETSLNIPYSTFSTMSVVSLLLAVFSLTIWTLSVALAKDKAGFHNLICHTRFIKGRL